MNLILFEPAELDRPLPRTDRRAVHLLSVLQRQPGDTFDAGMINGPRGKGTLVAIGPDALTFSFAWTHPAPAPEPLLLLVGLCRPQTARDILRDATTLGVAAVHFVATDKSERSYAQSSLWSSGEWRRHLVAGAEQAFDTRIPTVTVGRTLHEALADLAPGATRLALDNYEAPHPLGALCRPALLRPVILAVGSERGWSPAERETLRQAGFAFAHLGARVLRTETAVVAAVAITRAQLALG